MATKKKSTAKARGAKKRTPRARPRVRAATKKPVKTEKVEIPSGIAADLQVEEVELEDINVDDARFQFRVDRDNVSDIVKSLREQGQQVPIVLWGKKKPHLIIDGHRRTRAAAKLKMATIKAIIRTDITEEQAYQVAFLENAQRRTFNKFDQANALWVLTHQQKKTQLQAAELLGIKKDNASRLLKLLEMDAAIQKAVGDGTITMHHAMVLSKHPEVDLKEQVAKIKEHALSARGLAKSLGKTKTRGRKKTYFRKDGDGFWLSPLRFTAKTATDAMRAEMLAALEKAVEILKASDKPATKGPPSKDLVIPKTM